MSFTTDSKPLKTENTMIIAPLLTAIATILMRDSIGTAFALRLPRRYLNASCHISVLLKAKSQKSKVKSQKKIREVHSGSLPYRSLLPFRGRGFSFLIYFFKQLFHFKDM